MTLVSNDPIWWPLISANFINSYFAVAGSVGLMYDWMFSVLTFGQEVELIWVSGLSHLRENTITNPRQRQRWSLMTVLYLAVRYGGIFYATTYILMNVPAVPMTDAVGIAFYPRPVNLTTM
ncbi:hypothetical protein CY34DRAFT_18251 [Suillus luteus UH-Slu-Lm8-n1]|uniref:DUF6533 domain-containing protein n=1 Tax=Suillus luteus UH-Slu-Lm8-n1 TaxID=930992 RepID=A0A0D0AH88_9AGAM|nr:hypothetical protein CY34DRAFT_18251 [Suillus luteus UH-Slu-Lm8-n1]